MSDPGINRKGKFSEATDFGLDHGYPEQNLWVRVFSDCFLTLQNEHSFKNDKISARKFIFKDNICFDLLAASVDLTPDELRARVKKALARNGSRTKSPELSDFKIRFGKVTDYEKS